ncbi:hypothetical protein TRAPUB_303 [Trametes pubescens]|uniref:Uncharacterized protein n=1 Tax=Trametes pubescens TaxID=154538 RepID=A0A1M2VMH7_TRAPU|nr:hypothetical protein TRAPUB_303 [Trametes pubescens]
MGATAVVRAAFEGSDAPSVHGSQGGPRTCHPGSRGGLHAILDEPSQLVSLGIRACEAIRLIWKARARSIGGACVIGRVEESAPSVSIYNVYSNAKLCRRTRGRSAARIRSRAAPDSTFVMGWAARSQMAMRAEAKSRLTSTMLPSVQRQHHENRTVNGCRNAVANDVRR